MEMKILKKLNIDINKDGEVVEVNPKNKKFHRAYETQLIITALGKVKQGGIISYDELSEIAMGSCRHGEDKSNFLTSARIIVRKEAGIEFKAIHNIGLRRMTDSEKIAKNDKLNEQIVRKSKQGIASMASTNYDKLSDEDKVTFNKNMTLLNGHRVMGSAETVYKVVKAVRGRKEPLQLKEFAKMFNKRNHQE